MRVSFYVLAVLGQIGLVSVATPSSGVAQWPGGVSGQVIDAVSGREVSAARVSVPASGHRAVTDPSGRFHLTGLEPGEHLLRVEHPAYVAAEVPVSTLNGRTRMLIVSLQPAVLPLPGLRVTVDPAAGNGYRLVVRDALAPAGTAGDLIRSVPGVVVTDRGAGSAQTVSIRGSSPDDVLVLVDGVPLNDPVTGTADLSALPASAVAEVTVLPGARSARYGPGAEAGVVLVTTTVGTGSRGGCTDGCEGGGLDGGSGAAGAGVRAGVGAGSLGKRELRLGWEGDGGDLHWNVEGAAERVDGSFPFRRPAETGGGNAVRVNADVARWALRGGATGALAGGTLRARAAWESLDRGLPGRGYAPTPSARQEEQRLRASGEWLRDRSARRIRSDVWIARHAARFHDDAPPTGLPYDETTVVSAGGGGLSWTAAPLSSLVREVGVGGELEHQRVRSPSLHPAFVARTDAGVHARTSLRPTTALPMLEVALAGRLDRAGADGALHASHDVGVAARAGPVSFHVAHRSAFSPPALADQLFREGVGVRANPGLRGERIPSEVELGLSALVRGAGGRSLAGSVAAYSGDVRDMIVWAPDHRFVWSPSNVDVERRGLDVSGRLGVPLRTGEVEVEGAWSLARVTYARPELRDVQLRYRPRHTGHVAASWHRDGFRIGLETRYTGARHPVPSAANVLPGFWTADVAVALARTVGTWELRPAVRVSRLFGARHSMIFGFPEPGRTLSLSLEVRPRRERP